MTGSPVPDAHVETPDEPSTAPLTKRWLGLRPAVLIAIVAVLAVIVAVGVPLTVSQVQAAGIRADASADAKAYGDASAAAAEAEKSLATYAEHSKAFSDTLLVAVNDTVQASPGEFSDEAVALLAERLDAVQSAAANATGDADDVADDTAEVAAADSEEAASAPPVKLDGELASLEQRLQNAYLEADDELRALQRSYVAQETERMRAAASTAADLLAAMVEADSAADEAVIAIAKAAVAAGAATLEANPSASASTLDAAKAAIAEVEAATLLDAAGGALRAEETADADVAALVASLPTSLSSYVSTVVAVRASHQAAIAPPPAAPKNDGWCTWSVFYSGFPVWTWGPCSEMPR